MASIFEELGLDSARQTPPAPTPALSPALRGPAPAPTTPSIFKSLGLDTAQQAPRSPTTGLAAPKTAKEDIPPLPSWAQPAPAPAPEKEYNVWGAAKDVGKLFKDIPTHLKGAAGRLVEGPVDPLAEQTWADEAIAASRALAEQRRTDPGAEEYLLPFIQRKDIRDASASTGFSIAAMGSGLLGGLAGGAAGAAAGGVAAPAGFYAGAATASGMAAYRMASNEFITSALEQLNQESVRKTGKDMTNEEWDETYQQLLPHAQNAGLWEAGPEAIGNAVMLGVGGKLIAKLGKETFGKAMRRAAVSGAAIMGTELATESATQIGQQTEAVRAGLAQGDERSILSWDDWVKSFKEVGPQTAVLTTLLGGAGATVSGAAALARGKEPVPSQSEDEELARIFDQHPAMGSTPEAEVQQQPPGPTPSIDTQDEAEIARIFDEHPARVLTPEEELARVVSENPELAPTSEEELARIFAERPELAPTPEGPAATAEGQQAPPAPPRRQSPRIKRALDAAPTASQTELNASIKDLQSAQARLKNEDLKQDYQNAIDTLRGRQQGGERRSVLEFIAERGGINSEAGQGHGLDDYLNTRVQGQPASKNRVFSSTSEHDVGGTIEALEEAGFDIRSEDDLILAMDQELRGAEPVRTPLGQEEMLAQQEAEQARLRDMDLDAYDEYADLDEFDSNLMDLSAQIEAQEPGAAEDILERAAMQGLSSQQTQTLLEGWIQDEAKPSQPGAGQVPSAQGARPEPETEAAAAKTVAEPETTTTKEVTPHAPEKRQEPSSRQPEHPRDEEVRPPTQAGRRRGPEPGREGKEKEVTPREEMRAAQADREAAERQAEGLAPTTQREGAEQPTTAQAKRGAGVPDTGAGQKAGGVQGARAEATQDTGRAETQPATGRAAEEQAEQRGVENVRPGKGGQITQATPEPSGTREEPGGAAVRAPSEKATGKDRDVGGRAAELQPGPGLEGAVRGGTEPGERAVRPESTKGTQEEVPGVLSEQQRQGAEGAELPGSRRPIPREPATAGATGAPQAEHQTAAKIEAAAQEAATSPQNNLPEPTQAQKEAGNYKKGNISLNGLDISIENPKGSVRSGTDRSGKKWSVTLKDHYGYIKRTTGGDKEQVDVFLGPKAADPALPVYVIDQVHPDSGKFDEHKVMIGYHNRRAAMAAYRSNYAKGWKGLGNSTPMNQEAFKEWVKSGDATKPAAKAPSPVEVKPEEALGTPILKALTDELGNAAMAVRVNNAVEAKKPDDWLGSLPKERTVQGAIASVVGNDKELVDALFQAYKVQHIKDMRKGFQEVQEPAPVTELDDMVTAGNRIVSNNDLSNAEKRTQLAEFGISEKLIDRSLRHGFVDRLGGFTRADFRNEGARLPKKPAKVTEPSLAEITETTAPGESAQIESKPLEEDRVIEGSMALARAIKDFLATATKKMTWREFQAMANKAYGGKQTDGVWEIKRAYDAMELGFNQYVLENPATGTLDEQISTYEALQAKLPTQTRRSAEQVALQQFSTPHTHSHVVAWVAGIGPTDVVMEPSAGTGNIASHALLEGPDKVFVNELSEGRSALLKQLPVDAVRNENAQHIHALYPKEAERPTVVVMNPPFSANVLKPGVKDLEEGAKHVESALKLLSDNGRLVVILGRGMAWNAPRMKKVWGRITDKYNVRAVIRIDGKAYAKFGTSFDNVIAVIDKTGKTTGTPLLGDVKTVNELVPLLQALRDERIRSQPAGERGTEEAEAEAGRGIRPSGTTAAVGTEAGELRGPTPDEAGAAIVRGGTKQPAGQRAGPRDTGPRGPAGAPTGITKPTAPTRGAGQPAAKPAGGKAQRAGPIIPSPLAEPGTIGLTPTTAKSKQVGNTSFDSYAPQYTFEGAQDHPAPLDESTAMASIDAPPLTYTPNLPKTVITSGRLSNAQLQNVAYAGQAHEQILPGPDKYRRGFMIGDGTGVGKGAQIAGIIMDNWRQGRRKAVWVSENLNLVKDAKRDAEWVGFSKGTIFKPPAAGEAIGNPEGIQFTTYSTLSSASKEVKDLEGNITKASVLRLDQLVNWLGKDFDGVIAFDEAHNMGNAIAVQGHQGRTKDPSLAALAGIELQQRLPSARIVYVSATGATEVSNLAYAERLGLWGEGTPFGSKKRFVSEIQASGIAAMEVVAKDLKAQGAYQSRSISFDGVNYDTVTQTLTRNQRQTYNKMADAWQIVLQNVNEAMEGSGSSQNGRARSSAMSAFWNSQQRFFNQVMTAMQMPALLSSITTELAAGNSAVLQIVSTDEALQKRRVAQAQSAGMDLEDVDFTPRDILMQYLATSFPTTLYEEYTDDAGNTKTRAVTNAAGAPVEDPVAVERRDKLLEELGALDVPDGSLNQLLMHFGTDAVAEITGRGQRVVRNADGKVVIEKFTKAMKDRDAKQFEDGQKRILVFSDAGGTGRSYHASNTFKNQQKRIHYLVQPGWRASRAVQGFGRTHRTNQAQPPEYRLVTTNLSAQARFMSSIAKRLDQLGALTKGQRETGGQGIFDAEANLENQYGENALLVFIEDLYADNLSEIGTRDDIANQMGYRLFDNEGNRRDLNTSVPQFLNRVLSLRIETQELVFNRFLGTLKNSIEHAKATGTFDVGMEQLQKGAPANVAIPTAGKRKLRKLVKSSEQVIQDQGRGVTSYVRYKGTVSTPLNRDRSMLPETTVYYQNRKSGRVYGVYETSRMVDTRSGDMKTQVIVVGPTSRRSSLESAGLTQVIARDFSNEKGKLLTHNEVAPLWDAEIEKAPKTQEHDIHVISGALLPVWDRLPKTSGSQKVLRLQDASGDRRVGRLIAEKDIDATLRNLGMAPEVPKLTGEQWASRLIDEGKPLVLANGWKVKRSLVAGEHRIEVTGPTYSDVEVLKGQGLVSEMIQFKTRYFVPLDKAGAVLDRVLQNKPVVEVEGAKLSVRRQLRPSAAKTTTNQLALAVSEAVGKQTYRNLTESGTLNIVQSVADIPVSDRRGGIPADVLGLAIGDEIYLVADNTPLSEARGLLLHEIVHHDMEQMLGAPLFDEIKVRMRDMRDRGVTVVVDAYNAVPTDTAPGLIDEEAIAYLVQNQPKLPLVRRILAAIRAFLVRIGFDSKLIKHDDLVALANASLRRVSRGVSGYEAGLAPKPEDYLNLGIPLSQQSVQVRKILEGMDIEGVTPSMVGSDIYSQIKIEIGKERGYSWGAMSRNNQELERDASKQLMTAGIPGARYQGAPLSRRPLQPRCGKSSGTGRSYG